MLILSRRVGERIIIGEGADAITVMLVEVDRGKCRLGIEAPNGIPIRRSELSPDSPILQKRRARSEQ